MIKVISPIIALMILTGGIYLYAKQSENSFSVKSEEIGEVVLKVDCKKENQNE